jgi:hypothetical protein
MYQVAFPDMKNPVGLDGICDELDRTGQHHLDQIAAALESLAPRPGALVFAETRTLAIQLNGLEAALFTALDATTFLQVAQVYVTMTTASAVSFIDFVSSSVPFKIERIATRDERPFRNGSAGAAQRHFSEIMKDKGYLHAPVSTAAEDALFSLAQKSMFGGISEGAVIGASEGELQRELNHFIFFHNNYRSVPWIRGLTPLQKLGEFKEFTWMHSFDPFGYPGRRSFARHAT